MPAPRDVDPALAFRVTRVLRRARPDLVHTHLVHADVYGALAAPRLVSTKHNDDPFRAGVFRFLERGLAARASRIVTITDALARFQVERVGIPERKLVTIHYGLDALPEAWGETPPDDVPAAALVVLGVCRLEGQKGVDVAGGALARLRGPGAHVAVLGEGAEGTGLEDPARAPHVPRRPSTCTKRPWAPPTWPRWPTTRPPPDKRVGLRA